MTLEDLVGLHVLEGRGCGYVGDSQAEYLRMDGHVYQFVEDENDGYRSIMGFQIQVDHGVIPLTKGDWTRFDPIVIAIHKHPLWMKPRHRFNRKKNKWYHVDVANQQTIYGVSEQTGLVIFEYGTDYSDGLYPKYVASWTPEGRPPFVQEKPLCDMLPCDL